MQSLFHNSKFIGLMGSWDISIIGLPIILNLLFMKGMVVGFTVGFLVNQMGWNGFILSFVSVLPQNFIIIPIFIVTVTLAVFIFTENDSAAIYEENDRTHSANARKIYGCFRHDRFLLVHQELRRIYHLNLMKSVLEFCILKYYILIINLIYYYFKNNL